MAEAYEPLWTSEEARQYLRLKSIAALNRLVREQGLPFIPLNGKDRRYLQSQIDMWLTARMTHKPAQSAEPAPRTQKPTKPKPAVRRGKHCDKIIAQIGPHHQ